MFETTPGKRGLTCLAGLLLFTALILSMTPASALAALPLAAAPSVSGASADATPSVPATPTITSPSNGLRTKYLRTTVRVAISADTTMASVLRNGVAVASLATSNTTSAAFLVTLRYGANTLMASAGNPQGSVVSTRSVLVTVVAPVGAPVFTNAFDRKVFYRPYPTITGRTRGSTSGLELYLNGRRIRRVPAVSWRAFSFSRVPLRYGMNRIAVVAYNQFYRKGTPTIRVWRLDVSANFPTVVIVDKSELHIYFIRNYRLIGYYPCAIGKPSTPTPERIWRIDSKEYSSGVSGPRKMRLFQRVRSGSRYVYEYTRYAIHGTDTPSSIGHMASHGCIRMYNSHVLQLFPLVPLHTMVITRA